MSPSPMIFEIFLEDGYIWRLLDYRWNWNREIHFDEVRKFSHIYMDTRWAAWNICLWIQIHFGWRGAALNPDLTIFCWIFLPEYGVRKTSALNLSSNIAKLVFRGWQGNHKAKKTNDVVDILLKALGVMESWILGHCLKYQRCHRPVWQKIQAEGQSLTFAKL